MAVEMIFIIALAVMFVLGALLALGFLLFDAGEKKRWEQSEAEMTALFSQIERGGRDE